MKTLSKRQRSGVEELARKKGLRCHSCGSPELVSNDQVLLMLGPVKVDMMCEECGATEKLPLSLAEAKVLRIVRMRERPETTG